ncbi:MAG TPA: dienelactone hydrolase family protein [Stellaceae bacterium]|nr:dienelactone hydrolase family protein [Stellaceae bacterium]
MALETLRYKAGAVEAHGRLARPAGGNLRPGILVVHDGFGLGRQAERRARMLGELGYEALAVDLFGEGRIAGDLAEAYALTAALRDDADELRRRMQAGLDALAALPEVDAARLAAVGYCFGGTAALELARTGAPLAAVCCCHGALDTTMPARPGLAPRILACLGADDPLVPRGRIEAFAAEMTAAQADWQIHLYGGVKHNFTDPDAGRLNRPAVAEYHPTADHRAWTSLQALLSEAFGPQP